MYIACDRLLLYLESCFCLCLWSVCGPLLNMSESFWAWLPRKDLWSHCEKLCCHSFFCFKSMKCLTVVPLVCHSFSLDTDFYSKQCVSPRSFCRSQAETFQIFSIKTDLMQTNSCTFPGWRTKEVKYKPLRRQVKYQNIYWLLQQ